jgi:2-polyprenyl-6-methoxyphenol hydroxylase-like FAD-dependent oxidoreductase
MSSIAYQPKVVILGAGPGGLSCTLEVMSDGIVPTTLEMRPEGQPGRLNPVILIKEVMEQLEKNGIASDLSRQKLIFPPVDDRSTVRITDLEKTMRSAVKRVSASAHPILYETTVKDIRESGEKVDLVLSNGQVIEKVDVVVVAEGAKSSTNELLNNYRVNVLPDFMAVYSILKDDRPKVKNISTFLEAAAKTVRNSAKSFRDHAMYLALLGLVGEHFLSDTKNIAIAATLKTPGQNRVGFAFTKRVGDEIQQLAEDVKKGVRPREELDQELRFWTRIAFCEVNVFSALQKVGKLFGRKTEAMLSSASRYPIENTFPVTIHSDRAEHAAIVKNKTLFLMTGDALSTVDPSAVLGCNTAIQLGPHVLAAIRGVRQGKDLSEIAASYTAICDQWIERNHAIAREMRAKYDPSSRK